MRVIYFSADRDAAQWLPGLRTALPGADVQEWEPGSAQADYAVLWKPSQQLLDTQHHLKAIFNTGAGVDALLTRRLPPDVPVIRLDDAGMAVQMAEYVCQALIRHFRGLSTYETQSRAGLWQRGRTPQLRSDFPVGILGLGVLGQRVARALAQFDFPVNGWSQSSKAVAGVQCFAGASQLPDFLAASRVLVCLLPLTPDTQDILNRATLSLLQPGGYVINVARGAHVVDDDLLALLDSGHLAGATLDVFRSEPLPSVHPFWQHPHITITPHISACTLVEESITQIAGKILALERGQPVAGKVDLRQGY